MKLSLFALTLATSLTLASAASAATSTRPTKPGKAVAVATFRKADLEVQGFPVWLGADGKLDRVVVMVEGFDLYNACGAVDVMTMVGPVAKALLAAGLDTLVVDFPDSHLAPDALAPRLAEAIGAASAASGQPVAVVGLSAGGLVARWALVNAEESGQALPVHTLLLVDTPNRGAQLNPALQALVVRHGTDKDREAITCPAAQSLLRTVPGEVKWKRVGLPGLGRSVPVACKGDSTASGEFFGRLRGLNNRAGYPRTCRLVAVAQGSRESTQDRGRDNGVFRMWLPLNSGWRCPSDAADSLPGSLLPAGFVNRFKMRFPLGVAGSYVPTTPTFVPTESALDASPSETPPFHRWYARPRHATAIAHDEIDPEVASFVVRDLLTAWAPSTATGPTTVESAR